METRKRRSAIALILAGVAAVAGAIVLILALLTPLPPSASFGWFAYAPLSDTVFLPSDVIALPTWALVGVGLLVVGLVALSYMIGRRSGTNRSDNGSDSR